MAIVRVYDRSPFSWDGKSAETIRNDRNWLESIVRSAAPYSDWWTKARIVQLAYPLPPDTKPIRTLGVPTYAGLSEADIAHTLRSSVDLAQYPDFDYRVNEEYVVNTLNAWRSQQFSQAVSRNFDVYADRTYPNVFLVVSTAPVSLGVNRVLPPGDRFRPLFNIDELAKIINARNANQLTLRTHGYANFSKGFYEFFREEASGLNTPATLPDSSAPASVLPPEHFYIGYHWPSEQPVTSPGLWLDYRNAPGVLFKFLFVLSGLAGIFGTLLYLLLKFVVVPLFKALGTIPAFTPLWQWSNFSIVADQAVRLNWLIPTVFMTWLLLFLLLRIVVYQRDRYRAIHYGAPDLAEFFWRLDAALDDRENLVARPTDNGHSQRDRRLKVNLIGHSMGGLLLTNVLRILSDRFGKDDQGILTPDSMINPNQDAADDIGKHLELDKLILASPDIPLEFLREGRNNYVRSAMRRCRRIYLMSSDRDIVLRYLSTVGNWFTEPSIQMSGMRLGNVYLREAPKVKRGRRASKSSSSKISVPQTSEVPNYLPYIRIMTHSEEAVSPTSSYDLFRKFNYLDCSEMGGLGRDGGVNSVPFKLNSLNGLLIDFINTVWFILGTVTGINHLDVHGGYFQTQTRSFEIFKFLLTVSPFLDDDLIKAEIETLIKGSPIRFLPSQPWVMPKPEDVVSE